MPAPQGFDVEAQQGQVLRPCRLAGAGAGAGGLVGPLGPGGHRHRGVEGQGVTAFEVLAWGEVADDLGEAPVELGFDH